MSSTERKKKTGNRCTVEEKNFKIKMLQLMTVFKNYVKVCGTRARLLVRAFVTFFVALLVAFFRGFPPSSLSSLP
jgi:hypothetical protein